MSEETNGAADSAAAEAQAWLHLAIAPEPTGDEGEALIAAISVYLAASAQSESTNETKPAVSRWAAAGRREAIGGIAKSQGMGWGKGRAGWP